MKRHLQHPVLLGLAIALCIPSAVAAQSGASGRPQAAATEIDYGHSVRGRTLRAYVLGTGTNVTLIGGGIHGNETAAPIVASKLLAELRANPDELEGCEVILVPNVNPDGDAAHTRENAHGVDLNRNFPYHWAPKRQGVRLSTGSAALSEPESAGLLHLLDQFHPSKVVSIHQPLNMLIAVGPGGAALAAAMGSKNGYTAKADVGYPTPGSFGSYLWHVRHISCVTLEMPWGNPNSLWLSNKSSLLAAIHAPPIENVDSPGAVVSH
jgi:protein MpaA